MANPSYTLKIDGAAVYSGLSAAECEALVKVARRYRRGRIDSGVRIDTVLEKKGS